MSKALVFVLGLVFLVFGLTNAWLVSRAATHSDRELFLWAAFAIIGALVMEPLVMANALKNLGLAITRVLPGGRRGTDPKTGDLELPPPESRR